MLDPDLEFASLNRILIHGGYFNTDPCGFGSETLVKITGTNILGIVKANISSELQILCDYPFLRVYIMIC